MRVAALCVSALIASQLLSAQQPAAPPAPAPQPATQPQIPRPVFETGTELVLVDVTVVDNDSRPVKDLKLEEFDLQVNGQPRAIASAQYISTAPVVSTAPETQRSQQSSSNDAPTTGRLLLYVIDDGHMRLGASTSIVRTAEMLLSQLAPGDLVGLARLPNGTGGVEFTADRQRIREALKRPPGTSDRPGFNRSLRISEAWALETNDDTTWSEAVDRECGGLDPMSREACADSLEADARVLLSDATARANATLRALEIMFQRLATLKQPVSVIMISEGLFTARQPSAMTDLARRAAEARVTLHIVRPQNNMFADASFSGPAPSMRAASYDDNLMRDGLDQLAGQTRGRLVQIAAGTGAGVFERLSQELSGYYLIGFEPSAADRSGRERRIRVRTRRNGLTVRARPTFAIASDTTRAATEAARKPEMVLKEMLMAPLPERGLPMRVTAYSTSDPKDPRVRMVIAAEIGEPAEPGQPPVDWNVGVVILGDDDKVEASNAGVMKLFPASSRRPSPRLLQTTVLLDPGEYTLRLAAVDGEGRGGSVHHTLNAGLVELSGKRQVADLLVAPEPEPKLPTRLNASGIVDTENVTMQIDVSGLDAAAMAQTRVAVQIAESATGPALASANLQTIRRLGSVHTFGTTMKLSLLPPGEYVARATVTGGPKGEARVLRAFSLAPVAARQADTNAEPDPSLPVNPIDAPEDAFIPPPPPRINVSLPGFEPASVLRPAVVSAFLDELEDAHPGSPAASAVILKAREGAYEAPDPSKSIPAEDELSFAFVRGLAALKQDKFAQAQAWFQVALKEASDLLGAAFYIGASHAASGRDREAVGAWQIALLSSAADNVYPLLVDALLRLGDGLQALAFIDEAPGAWEDTDARDERQATAEAMTGSYVPALERLNQLIERRPEDRRLLYLSLQVMYRMRQEIGPLNDENRAHFADYATRYARAGGQNAALVASWQKFVERR